MAYCTQCGESNRPGARFCRVCGATVEWLEDEAATLPGRSFEVTRPISPEPDSPPQPLPVLQNGELLGTRYRILKLEETRENGDRVYTAEDKLTCWSCQAALPQAGLHYCENCGAVLSQFPAVRVVEIVEAGTGPAQEQVENGRRYRVEAAAATAGTAGTAGWAAAAAAAAAAGETVQSLRFIVGQQTSPGKVRESNEDSILVAQLTAISENAPDPQIQFFAIADGIGGNDAGEVASREAVRTLAEALYCQVLQPAFGGEALTADSLGERLRGMVRQANLKILEQRREKAVDMGSTLTALLLNGPEGMIANVGDSRTYLFRGAKLTQITADHSVVANLVADGLIQPEDVYSHDQRNVILRSLGEQPDLEVDLFPVSPQPGDRFLLCCDGLWEMVRAPLIEDVLLEQPDPQAACDRLVRFANLAGGEDNISVILVDVHLAENRSAF